MANKKTKETKDTTRSGSAVKKNGTKKETDITAPIDNSEKVQNGWSITEGFRNGAIEILKSQPYNEVNQLIVTIAKMETASDDEINNVINFLGNLPWESVHNFLGGLVPNLVQPRFE